MKRIALGSIFIECNHFGGQPADLDTFRRGELRQGAELLQATRGTLGGMIQALDGEAEIDPTLAASACPSGPLTAGCYAHLKTKLLDRLAAAPAVDGVLLALHGAAAAENACDLEGDLLDAVRAAVGDSVPIVATLDLHAHVTPAMIRAADALLAWETYPHADAHSTGQRGARALLDILSGQLNPTMALAKVPVLVGAIHGHTAPPGPFAEVMVRAKTTERQGAIYSASPILVHPYLDLPDMGGGAIVVTNNDLAAAEAFALELAQLYWANRHRLEPELVSPEAAIARGLKMDGGPVLLVETADCCGGGAAGDSVHALRALLQAGARPALAAVVDPAGARQCHEAGESAHLDLPLGHAVDPKWGEPLEVSGVVERLLDGDFTYGGGIWDGQHGDMGPSAVLRVGGVRVLVTSHGTYDWGTEQWDAAGLDWRAAKFVVVKNPMNHRRAFAGVAKAIYVLDTPGPTPASVRQLPFARMRGPWFPRVTDFPMTPEIIF